MTFLRDRVMLPDEPMRALGLAYHLADVFVPELHAALEGPEQQQEGCSAPAGGRASSNGRQQQAGRKRSFVEQQHEGGAPGGAGTQGVLPFEVLEALLEPFLATLRHADDQPMITRVRCVMHIM